MPVTNHTITVTINGTDKTSSLLRDSIFVKLQQNSKANIAELKFKNYDPPERSEVKITFDGTDVFGGYIVRKSATLLGVKNSSAVIWACECKSWAELFDIPKITAQYVTQSDRIIINSLFNQYMVDSEDQPLFDTTTSVSTLDSGIDIAFNDVSLTEALDQLAKRVGAAWYVKPNKELFWYDKNVGVAASFGISSDPNQSTTFGFLQNSLAYEVDSSTIINQVKIVGGVTSNGEKIEDSSNAGDGSTKGFVLEFIPNSIAYVGWNDGLGTYTSYGSFVGYAPQDKLRSQGGNYLVVCDQNARTVYIEGSTGLAPADDTGVTIHYYKKELVASTYDDLVSQSMFGIYPITIEDKEFVSVEASEQLANNILEQNAYGKTTLKFDTTKYGLLPGYFFLADIAELNVYADWVQALLTTEGYDYLTTEAGGYLVLESYATGRSFIVQEVNIQPVLTQNNEYMFVCQVTAGKYIPNLIDALSQVPELKSSANQAVNNPIPTRLSNISSDLGEVQIGRAVFTDGGTARYKWGTPNYATGVVIGLEDRTALQGAMYIYDSGSARVKLGYLADMPALGTVTPSGWGIYTDNGFFRGVVYASQLIGGTVVGGTITGGYISGGTITGVYVSGGSVEGGTIFAPRIIGGTISSGLIETMSLTGNSLSANTISSGTITGNTITGNQIAGGTITGTRITGGSIVGNTIIGGTIATGTPPINSSNPGVYLDATGLYGYDNVGLTFRLATDPTIKPWFSSGTILNTTYEINTASVLRTGTTNPRIQIDNSGIFAYNSSGALKFTVDVATGLLTASGATINGTVSASKFTGGTVEAGTITGNVFTAGTISAGTITGNQITSGTITGNQINGGTITAGLFTGGTITAGLFTGGTVQSGTVTGAFISGGTVQAGLFTSGTVNGGTVASSVINAGTVTGAQIAGGTVTGALVSGGTVSGGLLTVVGGSVTVDNSNGIVIRPNSSFVGTDARAIKFYDGSNYVASFGATDSGGINFTGGLVGTDEGFFEVFVQGTTGHNTNFHQHTNYINFYIDSVEYLRFDATLTSIVAYKNFIADDSANNRTIGDSTHGFRYLYLKDDNGNVRRVSINTSGVLTVT